MGMKPTALLLSDASGGAKTALCPVNWREAPTNITIRTTVVGTVAYNMQYTADDIRAPGWTEAGANWATLTGMAAAIAGAEATIISPITCLRLQLSTGTGSVSAAIVSAGN